MSQDEFNSFLKRHAGLIYKVAFTYCRNPADREDVIQEIAIQLWKSLDRYDDRFNETTWIYRIAINVAISFHRRERRHSQLRKSIDDASAGMIAAPSTEPNHGLELLMHCVEDLADMERALILLYLEGTDHATIAEILGISVSNVGTKLQRIKTKLGAALKGRLKQNTGEESNGTR
ncbi:MAG: RNA polymerase sigma factor [Planctomycetota bacterium]|jgi:RNA polymerase sigma factor (sigma-70 family)